MSDNPLGLPRRERRQIGPTGDYPSGKMHESDEGGIRLAIGHKDGRVIVDFGGQVTWFGLGVEEAKAFIELIGKHIEAIEKGE